MAGDAEVRLGCLELAVQLAKPSGDYSVNSVVIIARELYNFCQAPPPVEEPEENADKPRRGRKPRVDDLLS